MKPINLKKAADVSREAGTVYSTLLAVRSGAGTGCYCSTTGAFEREPARLHTAWNQLQEDLTAALSPVTAELNAVQRRCSARCITAEDILDCLTDLRKRLDISNKAMEGVSVDVDLHAHTFSRSYGWAYPKSTQFTAIYKNGSWRITDIRRDYTRPGPRRIVATHTDASRAAILNRFTVIA